MRHDTVSDDRHPGPRPVAGLRAGGCGVYSASSGRVDESLKRVAVEYLENQTSEPNIDVDLTDAIIRALQKDNTLKVVDEAAADSIISGRVVRYRCARWRARQDLTVNEYQVQIAVALTLTRRATGEKIFKNRRFTGSGNYVLDDPTAPPRDAPGTRPPRRSCGHPGPGRGGLVDGLPQEQGRRRCRGSRNWSTRT